MKNLITESKTNVKTFNTLILSLLVGVTAQAENADPREIGAIQIESPSSRPVTEGYCKAREHLLNSSQQIPESALETKEDHEISVKLFADDMGPRKFTARSHMKFNWGSRSLVKKAGADYTQLIEREFYSMLPRSNLSTNSIARLVTRSSLLLCDIVMGQLEAVFVVEGSYQESITSAPLLSPYDLQKIAGQLATKRDLIAATEKTNRNHLDHDHQKKVLAGSLLGYELSKVNALKLSERTYSIAQTLITNLFDKKNFEPLNLGSTSSEELSAKLVTKTTTERPMNLKITIKASP